MFESDEDETDKLPAIDLEIIANEAMHAERERCAAIAFMCCARGRPDLTSAFYESGATVEQVLERLDRVAPASHPIDEANPLASGLR